MYLVDKNVLDCQFKISHGIFCCLVLHDIRIRTAFSSLNRDSGGAGRDTGFHCETGTVPVRQFLWEAYTEVSGEKVEVLTITYDQ